MDDQGERLIAVLGPAGAHDVLEALTQAEAEREALIAKYPAPEDAPRLAEALVELETDLDDSTRIQLIDSLQRELT
ncbi:MAG: hypothetical protein QOE25_1432 [Actinomycetota bacterium]|nr:hypothetical protein [Actinomycetota bacterium]